MLPTSRPASAWSIQPRSLYRHPNSDQPEENYSEQPGRFTKSGFRIDLQQRRLDLIGNVSSDRAPNSLKHRIPGVVTKLNFSALAGKLDIYSPRVVGSFAWIFLYECFSLSIEH